MDLPEIACKKILMRDSIGLFFTYPAYPSVPTLNDSKIESQMGVMQLVTFVPRSLKMNLSNLSHRRQWDTYPNMMPKVELS